MMDGAMNPLKRLRHETGQGEAGPQEKKLFSQSSTESPGSYRRHRSFSMSDSSMTLASSNSMGSSSSRGDHEDTMIHVDSPQDVSVDEEKTYKLDVRSHDGGQIIFGVEDGTGKVKGQYISCIRSECHFFENIQKKIFTHIKDHTLWLSRQGLSNTLPDEILKIHHIPVKNGPKGRTLEDEFLAVIIVEIHPFDGIVFKSSDGPEAYKINEESLKIVRLTPEEWLREYQRVICVKAVVDGLTRLNLKYDLVSEVPCILEPNNNTSRIREKLFKLSKEFTIHPKGFSSKTNASKITGIQQSFQAMVDKGIILAEKSPIAEWLVILSECYGIHIYMMPTKRGQYTDDLTEQLANYSILWKTNLYKKGDCRINLVIRNHLVLEDDVDEKQLVSSLETSKEHYFSESQLNQILDSYIRVAGSFHNHILSQEIGVEVLNVLTEKQFKVLTRAHVNSSQKLWVHGLPGTGKTVLAVMLTKHLVKCGEGPVLFVAENIGLITTVRGVICQDVRCMSREEFLKRPESFFKEINSIVMDEVHHYRFDKEKPDWYRRAVNIVSRESGSDNGYLWLFLDMFQKENKFKSGIPNLRDQSSKVALTEIVRCSGTIWEGVKSLLERATLVEPGYQEYYRVLLSKSVCLDTVHGQEVDIYDSKKHQHEFALHFQIAEIFKSLLDQYWKASDIGILFSVMKDAELFTKQYNRYAMVCGEMRLKLCTDITPDNHVVCDSIRRFSGLEKPCIILVEPTVNGACFSDIAFQALGMSRAMVKLVIIRPRSRFYRQNST